MLCLSECKIQSLIIKKGIGNNNYDTITLIYIALELFKNPFVHTIVKADINKTCTSGFIFPQSNIFCIFSVKGSLSITERSSSLTSASFPEIQKC